MNKKGFTLIELLATLVVLGLIFSLSIVGINYSINNAKKKTEKIFISTLTDAIKIYLDDSANFASVREVDWQFVGTIPKTYGDTKLYVLSNPISFDTIINSGYTPIVESDLRNPATKKLCDKNARIYIYRDEDEVYYYFINNDDMIENETDTSCLFDNTINHITNLSEYALAMING